MPRIGHSMTEGTLVAWRVAPGASVHAGEVVLVIETDKAEVEVESPADGVLAGPLVSPDEVAPVGAVLGWVLGPGEPAPMAGGAPAGSSGEAAGAFAGATASAGSEAPPAAPGRVRASPRARRLALERGLDLARVAGSGPEGLVTEADVERALQEPASAPELFAGRRIAERRRLEPLRRTSARRTTEAWTHVPHIVQMIDVEVTQLEALRREWKRAGGARAGITLNDAIVKAAATVLAEQPELNAAVDGDELLRFAEVNAGIAVDTPRGLVVPVVPQADRLTLLELSLERRRLAEKARAGGLSPAELGTSTFTVSNLGAFGIRAGTPVLNSPEAVLVFVGAAEERAVVRDGALAIRPVLTLSIAYDHRVADGARAARATARIRGLLEEPAPILAGLESST